MKVLFWNTYSNFFLAIQIVSDIHADLCQIIIMPGLLPLTISN